MPDPLVPHMRRKHLTNNKNRSVNLKKLILTLEPGQIPENEDEDMTNKIKSWFIIFDDEVTVKPMEENVNVYTIIFQDVDAANEALEKFKDKGFNIRFKYPPRPSPSLHIKYKALADLQIRKGKSLKGYLFTGVVKRGELV